jgi:hypothetical protein
LHLSRKRSPAVSTSSIKVMSVAMWRVVKGQSSPHPGDRVFSLEAGKFLSSAHR